MRLVLSAQALALRRYEGRLLKETLVLSKFRAMVCVLGEGPAFWIFSVLTDKGEGL